MKTGWIAAATAGIAGAMLASPPAAASDWGREQQTIVVNVRALDLSTAAGIDLLVYRLRAAIDRLCDDDRQCRDEAWESADWQAARAISRDRWRARVAMERAADWERYGPPEPPAPVYAGTPPVYPGGQVDSVKKVTEITTTRTVRTRFVIAYRDVPPDYGWQPR